LIASIHQARAGLPASEQLRPVRLQVSVARAEIQQLPARRCLPVNALVLQQFYTVCQKTRHQTLGHNFTNYYPIFNFFSLADSIVNLQQIHV